MPFFFEHILSKRGEKKRKNGSRDHIPGPCTKVLLHFHPRLHFKYVDVIKKRIPSAFEEFSKLVANAVEFGMLCSVSPALLLRANSIAPEFTSHSPKQHRFMGKISRKVEAFRLISFEESRR
jgi:hypothetical protein